MRGASRPPGCVSNLFVSGDEDSRAKLDGVARIGIVPRTSPSRPNASGLIGAAQRGFGPIDVLVNNAALTYYVPIKDYPVSKWMRSWAVNFHAPFILSQLALQEMIPRRTGAIVNISSLYRIAFTFLLGSLAGVPLGLAMGLFRPVLICLEPYVR